MGQHASTLQSSFTDGELDPRLTDRRGVKQYHNGAARLRNVHVRPLGGVYRSPGTAFVNEVADASSGYRWTDFDFNDTQRYSLLFTENRIRFYRDGELITNINGSGNDFLTGAHTGAQLDHLTWTQSADTMLLFHEDVATQKLVRGAGHNLWTLSAFAFENIPTYDFTPATSNPGFTLTPSAKEGSVNLTTGGAFWVAGTHVGQKVSGNGGRARIVQVNSTTVAVALVEIPFYDVTAIAAGNWTLHTGFEDAWSVTRGFPRSGLFAGGALWIGGSKSRPDTAWRSRVGLFTDFDLGLALDDDAIEYPLGGTKVAAIYQLAEQNGMEFFTSSGVWVDRRKTDDPITPTNFQPKLQDAVPVDRRVKPVSLSSASVFVDSAGAVREVLFQIDTERSSVTDISLLSSHITGTPKRLAKREQPESKVGDWLLAPNGSGGLAVATAKRDNEVMAWTLRETRGEFLDVICEGSIVMLLVKRTIDGVIRYYVERMESAHLTDAGVRLTTGMPTATITGLSHLNGQACVAIRDGFVVGAVTPSGGSVTLDDAAATSIEVGLRFITTGDVGDCHVKTMPAAIDTDRGSSKGKKLKVVECTIGLYETGPGIKLGANGRAASEVPLRTLGALLLDQPIAPFTGDKRIDGFLDFDTLAQVDVIQGEPAAFELLSVTREVSVNS